MFGGLGMMELLIILFIVVLIFGAGKLPELGAGMGKAIRNFKSGVAEPVEKKDEEKEKIDHEKQA